MLRPYEKNSEYSNGFSNLHIMEHLAILHNFSTLIVYADP